MSQQKKGWGKKTVTAMYTSKDDLTPLLYSGKIIIIKKIQKNCVNKTGFWDWHMHIVAYGMTGLQGTAV